MSTHSVLSLWLLLKVLVPKDLTKYKVKLIFIYVDDNLYSLLRKKDIYVSKFSKATKKSIFSFLAKSSQYIYRCNISLIGSS